MIGAWELDVEENILTKERGNKKDNEGPVLCKSYPRLNLISSSLTIRFNVILPLVLKPEKWFLSFCVTDQNFV
jgi:hypothetical protein